mgnify:CR=1 FL=1|tara:strand:+ start:61 stop:270 length:210 start_codon:yes stop_codon:yes gene_type:complete
MINQQIIEIQERMFQVKRKLSLDQLNLDKHKDWALLLKQFYHVDSLFKADGMLWVCNEIKTVEYEEIKD